MPKSSSKYWGGFFPEYELRRRETGFKYRLGWESKIKCVLYSSLKPHNSLYHLSDYHKKGSNGLHGGIFNLEFSPDGKQLVAACENKALMMFDPLTKKLIYDVPKAHTGCVNGIKFLDNRLFATCSDDKTVALWDLRNIKRKISNLIGHTHWVKNIEYSSVEGMLITSGFDGKILGWNINRYNENKSNFVELLSVKGLMRTRITPDLSKLVICTTAGYIIVVHDLNLKYLAEDLKGFHPNLCQLLYSEEACLDRFPKLKKLLSSTRNRIEFIDDFPTSNDAEVIHSLQVHPQAWCVLSRNTSIENTSEWTCVHDVQAQSINEKRHNFEENESDDESLMNDLRKHPLDAPSTRVAEGRQREVVQSLPERSTIQEVENSRVIVDDDSSTDEESGEELEELASTMWFSRRRRIWNRNFSRLGEVHYNGLYYRGEIFPVVDVLNSSDDRDNQNVHHALMVVNGDQASISQDSSPTGSSSNPGQDPVRLVRYVGRDRHLLLTHSSGHTSTIALPALENRNYAQRSRNGITGDQCDTGSLHSAARLTHFIEEPNKGKGFIKELCFSADGRLICSPYDFGVRLLSFDENCSELSHCVQETPQQLHVISNNLCHTNIVVCTKFSPNDCLLVSGCLNGQLVWHQPVL